MFIFLCFLPSSSSPFFLPSSFYPSSPFLFLFFLVLSVLFFFCFHLCLSCSSSPSSPLRPSLLNCFFLLMFDRLSINHFNLFLPIIVLLLHVSLHLPLLFLLVLIPLYFLLTLVVCNLGTTTPKSGAGQKPPEKQCFRANTPRKKKETETPPSKGWRKCPLWTPQKGGAKKKQLKKHYVLKGHIPQTVNILREYIYTHTYMLWSYYLGQVWPVQGLLSGPSRGYYLRQGHFYPIFILVSSDFLHIQLSLCVFCLVFQKLRAKTIFFRFPFLEFDFEKSLLLALLKPHKLGVLWFFFVFCCYKRRTKW